MKKLVFLIMGVIFFVFPEQIYSEERRAAESAPGLSDFTEEIDAVEHKIKKMDEKIIALSEKSALQETEVQHMERAVKEASEKIAEAEQTQKFHEQQVKERLKTLYRSYIETEPVEEFFSVQNNENSLNGFYYIKTLLSLDYKELQIYSSETEKSKKNKDQLLEIKKELTEEKEKMENTEAQLIKEMEEKEIYLNSLYYSEKEMENNLLLLEKETDNTVSQEKPEEEPIVEVLVNNQIKEPELTSLKNYGQSETEFAAEESFEKIEDLDEVNIVMGWERAVPEKEINSPGPEEEKKLIDEEAAEKEDQPQEVSGMAKSVIFHRPADGRITSPFNPARIHPITGEVRAHNGTDFGRDGGTNIYAAESGIVTVSEWRKGLGNAIHLAHTIDGKTYITVYGHLASMHVKEGDYVERGEIVAVMGTTGLSTWVHLHFEVHPGGYRGGETAVDPEKYLP